MTLEFQSTLKVVLPGTEDSQYKSLKLTDITKIGIANIPSDDGFKLSQAIFMAPSRTYGEAYIEPVIRKIYGFTKPQIGEYDAIDLKSNTRYEIKATKAFLPRPRKMPTNNLYEKIILQSGVELSSRVVSFNDRFTAKYNANVQNVKRDHFDYLIYTILYKEGMEVFHAPTLEVNKTKIPNWSDKHGRYDQLGKSGQFNINSANIKLHEKQYFSHFFTWDELVPLFKSLP